MAVSEQKSTIDQYEAEDRELEMALGQIWDIAHEFHLDPFPTNFEIVPPNIVYELASYNLPNRFSHWTHGRAYRNMKTMYDHGISKIYELVINSNPSQAFLLENNPLIENKFIIAHVLGHTDFFKNNRLFLSTRQDMPSAAAQNAQRIQQYEHDQGALVVEKVLDAALAIEEHVDPYLLFRPQPEEEQRLWRDQAKKEKRALSQDAGEFSDLLGQPKKKPPETKKAPISFPPTPDRDILGFIRNYAPYLEDWERDIVDIIRSESVYFWPQRRTKIMNEGWASYWHKRLMREMGDRGLITPADNEAWWRLHSSVVAPSPKRINPYYLGMKIYEYLEDYYNGNLSEEEIAWLKKEDLPVYPRFTGKLQDSPGLAKIREVVAFDDDQSFIRNHFNKIVADRTGMYIYDEEDGPNGEIIYRVKEKGWLQIRDLMVDSMTNCGFPYIVVVDGNYHRRQELFLEHHYEGRPLDEEYVRKNLPYIYSLWRRPVYLKTMNDDNHALVYCFDGEKIILDEEQT